MAIDFNQIRNAQNTNGRSMPFGDQTSPNSDKPKADRWLNVGYEVTTAEGIEFITLPLGQPIDTMDAAKIRGQNVDFVKKISAQNQLLEMLQHLPLEPGEEQTLNLVVKIRRVNKPVAIAQGENEFSFNPASLIKRPALAEAAE
ncbi:hypothetical protein [Mesorhizobium sp. M7A.F.Ca.CA.002.12.1.1]|uniref:hypothetical protein n=1 Tax=Mesorhizobium sp. M7A.F.Ca.CA.002.12.1.1 TaxID=2496735 RepID=UPI000FCCC327|nr:hypothetical protein [Mesorhizobium sp. M7A.F.Ca.CA.002.12.1.1]RUX60142.1 hypothetical protein EN989_11015 [Mesorhizobium sp. M7A.F.Ca.CA.002.12.1.1]